MANVTKKEMIKLMVEETGVESQKRMEEILDGIDNVLVKAFNSAGEGDKIFLTDALDVKKAVRKGREGECKIPGKEGTWKTEDKFVARVKVKKAFEDRIEQ